MMKTESLKTESFCILPFIHLAITPTLEVKTCSKAAGQLARLEEEGGDSIEAVWNSEKMKNIRLKMLKGEKVLNCKRCYAEEKGGYIGKRVGTNRHWSELYGADFQDILSKMRPDGSMPFKIHYLEFSPGIKCNLKCLTCDPGNSNLWIKDYKAIYPKMQNPALKNSYEWMNAVKTHYDWHKNPVIQKQIYGQLKNIINLHFVGGEPLIIDEHYKILDHCISNNYAKNMNLIYSSNGTTWRDNLFEKWRHFASVEILYSIDDIGERNNYIRYPSKWNRVEKVSNIFDEQLPDNVEVLIVCTAQILNVYYLPDFIDWFLSKNFKRIKNFDFNLLHSPPQLNPQVLPLDFKKKLRKKYIDFLSRLSRNQSDYWIYPLASDLLTSVLNFVEDEDLSDRLPSFREYIKLLDEQRNTSVLTAFPDLEVFL